MRGLYLGAVPSEPAVRAWTEAFRQAVASPGYGALRERHGLYPFTLTGASLEDFVRGCIEAYRRLADELGLRRWAYAAGRGSIFLPGNLIRSSDSQGMIRCITRDFPSCKNDSSPHHHNTKRKDALSCDSPPKAASRSQP